MDKRLNQEVTYKHPSQREHKQENYNELLDEYTLVAKCTSVVRVPNEANRSGSPKSMKFFLLMLTRHLQSLHLLVHRVDTERCCTCERNKIIRTKRQHGHDFQGSISANLFLIMQMWLERQMTLCDRIYVLHLRLQLVHHAFLSYI